MEAERHCPRRNSLRVAPEQAQHAALRARGRERIRLARCIHPGVHASQLVDPASAWKVPASHMTHVDALSWSLNVPGAQSVGVSEPTEQNVPRGQVTQSSTLVITLSERFMCVPPGHGKGAALPSAQ